MTVKPNNIEIFIDSGNKTLKWNEIIGGIDTIEFDIATYDCLAHYSHDER